MAMSEQYATFKLWAKGLVSAVIGGAANSITLMLIDPMNYNLSEGLPKLGAVAAAGAIISAAMYLKQSPVP